MGTSLSGEDDYEHEGFQAVYCKELSPTRAEMLYRVLLSYNAQYPLSNLFIYDHTTDLERLNFKAHTLRVASFGCGPGWFQSLLFKSKGSLHPITKQN